MHEKKSICFSHQMTCVISNRAGGYGGILILRKMRKNKKKYFLNFAFACVFRFALKKIFEKRIVSQSTGNALKRIEMK